SQPRGICIDVVGNIYVTDYFNQRIRKIDTFGIISTIAGCAATGSYGGDGGPATLAHLYQPQGITTDSAGNIYFCDRNNNRIRKINTSGIITTLAGNGTGAYSGDGCAATAASLYLPEYLVLDHSHNIYFSDYYNNRVREIVNG